MNYLNDLAKANDSQLPLDQRVGYLDKLSHEFHNFDHDDMEQYVRIAKDVRDRLQHMYNPGHAPQS